MRERMTKGWIHNRMGVEGDNIVVGRYHIEVPVKSVIKLGGKGAVKNLKAGESYLVRFDATVNPRSTVVEVCVNPLFNQHGLMSEYWVHTPIHGRRDLATVFECKADFSIDDLEYGVHLMSDDTMYGRWK